MKRALVLLIVGISFVVLADTWTDSNTGYKWTYRVIGDGSEISDTSSSAQPAISPKAVGYLVVPSTLGGRPVVSIGQFAFRYCDEITGIDIPNSVTNIGYQAFYRCACLESIRIPEGLKSISPGAFYGCDSLTSIKIPAGVEYIGYGAFGCCKNLISIEVEDANENYEVTNGLLICKEDLSIVASSVNLTEVSIPEGVARIGSCSFSDCRNLTSLEIPMGISDIGNNAFQNCANLVSVSIPNSVTNIGNDVFWGCSSLANMKLPFVGKRRGNNGLESLFGIIFSHTVYYAGAGIIFRIGQTGDFDGGVAVVQYYGSNVNDYGRCCVPASLRTIEITDETSICYGAFYGCSNLVSVTLNEGVTNVEDYAFYGCSGLMSVTLGDGLTAIKESTFEDCANLEDVRIPSSVMCIEDCAFARCSSLKEVAIPYGVKSIGADAFSVCNSLTCVTIPNSVTEIYDGAFTNCRNLKRVSLPDSVEYIGSYAFAGCDNLADVRLGSGFVEIGVDLFDGCWALRDLTIPQYVCNCKLSEVFDEYRAVTNIVVSEGTTLIGNEAFSGCTNLKSVTLPSSVTRIGDEAFKDCASLKTLVFEGDAPDFGDDIYVGTPRTLVTCIGDKSIGWSGGISSDLPSDWNGRAIAVTHEGGSGGIDGSVINGTAVYLTTTNIVIHYVSTSVPSEAVTPSEETGLVNIIAEVRAENKPVAISSAWADQYGEAFTAKFGDDFAAAITAPTGKKDGAGNAMCVWQDYVAGTDPTDEDDVFTASITFDKETGNPIISWTPELSEAEAAKRVYKKFGKVKLNDAEWVEVDGNEADYNFFKVSVEMK